MIHQSLKRLNSFSVGRLFTAGSPRLRGFCTAMEAETAVVDDDSSAGALADEPGSTNAAWRLYRRLSGIGATGGRVANVLDGTIREGSVVGKKDLLGCVKKLRKFKRYHHCFEIFEWMDKANYNYSHRDLALRLDIICKTKGIDEAEKFFEGLSPEEKNLYTYGALLNCYCNEKWTDKAFKLVEEMEKMKYVSALSFSNLITLALTTGEPQKVPALVEEMKKRNFGVSAYVYALLLQSYQQLNDMEAVERTLQEIENDGKNVHWSIYSNLAAVYIRNGDPEKAVMALKKLEEASKTEKVRGPLPSHYLISFYAGMGNSAEVNRVWESLKSTFRTTSNVSYLVMLQALLKLGQLDELVKCFNEWKSGHKVYDPRLASVVISNYLRQNKTEEAEAVLNDAVVKSGTAFFKGREMLVAHFLDKGEINLALEHFEAAVNAVKENDKWQPNPERIFALRQYFEEQKDVDGAEKLLELLRKLKCLKSQSYLFLLRTYVAAGRTASDMRQRMKEDGIEITSEHEAHLEKVCPL